MKQMLVGLALGLSTSLAWAQPLPAAQVETPTFAATISEYYTFADSGSARKRNFQAPAEIFQDVLKATQTSVNLLSWTLHPEAFPAPHARYQRLDQFGRWINDPADDSCMNTRAQVLVRDSRIDVTYRPTNHCVVATGEWLDPYAGDELTHSQQVQIDHVVPLKNAYITGAFKWNAKTRRLYANFMGVAYHLLPVEAHENMSKGDKSPDAYIPPNEETRCEYLQHWLKIKATWNLVMTRPEAEGIQRLVRESHCQEADFTMSTQELVKIRSYIQNHLNDFDGDSGT